MEDQIGNDEVLESGASFWDFIIYLYANDGIWVLLFIALAFVFYKLIWRVWSGAMDSKDSEIVRLVKERDFYQRKVFPDLLTSSPSQSEGEEDEPT